MTVDSQAFFEKPAFASVAGSVGTMALAQRCNRLLSQHILQSLPDLRDQVKTELKSKQELLLQLGSPVTGDKASQGWMLLDQLQNFVDLFRAKIDGTSSDATEL